MALCCRFISTNGLRGKDILVRRGETDWSRQGQKCPCSFETHLAQHLGDLLNADIEVRARII